MRSAQMMNALCLYCFWLSPRASLTEGEDLGTVLYILCDCLWCVGRLSRVPWGVR